MSESSADGCLLCGSTNNQQIARDKRRPYLLCADCDLVFVPQNYHLSSEQEKAQYDLHQNDVNDAGYRKFLSRTLTPLFKKIPAPALGLDFGCGPGPAIQTMAQEQGYQVINYDPFFAPNKTFAEHQYDFITMTEVLEHICQPMPVFEQLVPLLKQNSILAIMTKRVESIDKFQSWHYKNDPTHIAFYSMSTFNYIAKQFQLEVIKIDRDVVFLQTD